MMAVHRRRQSETFSLLPFMAVLICTMGALIVLLVVLVQQARVSADSIGEAEPTQPLEDDVDLDAITRQIEDASWRAEILNQSRRQMIERLADGRLQLSHIEEHIRRLEDRIDVLGEQVAALDNDDPSRLRNIEADRLELARLLAEVETARTELEAARREAAEHPQSYALIPYDGPTGTHRRPIYIECLADRVVLRPEGIELVAEDFRPPLGPQNALASALRTVREYLARTGQVGVGSEPYPLLIVRPDGATSYAAARRAMQSWDAEFGYELIEDEVTLEYPPADPQLVAELQRTVDEARRIQRDLARAAPSRHGRGNSLGLTASRDGGFEAIVGIDENRLPGSSGEGRWGEHAPGSSTEDASIRPESSSPTDEQSSQSVEARGGSGGPSSIDGGQDSSPLADRRGQNWGLPNFAPSATGFTRPIRVVIDTKRIVVIPERGAGDPPIVIAAEGQIANAVDALVAALWDRVERWGTAGENAYWKPVLTIEVAPGADQRYETLSRLFQRSGIDVTRRGL